MSRPDVHRIPAAGGDVLPWLAPGSLPVGPLSPGPWAVARRDPETGDHLIEVDHLGLQPLYWTQLRDGSILASSWLANLIDQPGVDQTYDLDVVLFEAMRLPPIGEFATRTRFRAVHRVPGGHRLRIRGDGTHRLERYWDAADLPEVDHRISLHDAADLLRERVDRAIARQLPTDGGIAGHVSGGLDCTAVTCRAQQLLAASGRSLTAAYSWSPTERLLARLEQDERRLIDDVEHVLGIPVERLTPTEDAGWFDELTADRYPQTTHVYERFVLPRAREAGVTTMLSGWGGDELASFYGRGVVRALVRRGRWLSMWRHTRQRVALMDGVDPGLARSCRIAVRNVLAHAPAPIQRFRRSDQATTDSNLEAEVDRLLREAAPAVADVARVAARRLDDARDHHELQLALLTNGHLQRRADGWYQTGRLFGIDYRYPLLDLDVVTAALTLPWTAYASHGWTRTAFRLAVDPWVPPSVAWNLSKDEPALFHDAVTPTLRSSADRLPDDPAYRSTVDLARRIHELRPRRPIPPRDVLARPDLAPRRP